MWYWDVHYKDFCGEWVHTLRTRDVFRATDRFDWWQRYGHAAKIEAYRTVDGVVEKDDGLPDDG